VFLRGDIVSGWGELGSAIRRSLSRALESIVGAGALSALRFHVDGFYPEKLTREYVKREVRRKLSIPELEERGLMEIIVSKKGIDGL
jgi:hypothetical protein